MTFIMGLFIGAGVVFLLKRRPKIYNIALHIDEEDAINYIRRDEDIRKLKKELGLDKE